LNPYRFGRAPGPPLYDEGEYQEWLSALIKRLRPGELHKVRRNEEQWVECAVYEGWLAWAPDEPAVVLGGRGLPPPFHRPSAFEYWLGGVVAALKRNEGTTYPVAEDERKWAAQAVAAGELVWAEEALTLRLAGEAPTPLAQGPYR
jgi:hypothetical protein